MRIARFESQGRTSFGLVEGESVTPIAGDPFGDRRPSGPPVPLANVRLLAPWQPRQILAAAVNYKSHAGERPASSKPELFLKAPSSIVGPGDAIVLPKGAERVDFEGELVAVIGHRCRNISPAEALSYVLGYTCGNDVSARDWQRADTQWWRAKSSDTFSPLGPWIVDGLDPANLELRTRVNGEEVQSTNTGLLIHSLADIISFASRVMTLEPGDVIYTGTPGQTQPLKPGDTVEVEVGGIGVLRNPVVAEG
jgi:2-keto-4-pentenoate hydratase/2-oxohepta-3-ene-1,7-dioic acid hydratase in catechol pathway